MNRPPLTFGIAAICGAFACSSTGADDARSGASGDTTTGGGATGTVQGGSGTATSTAGGSTSATSNGSSGASSAGTGDSGGSTSPSSEVTGTNGGSPSTTATATTAASTSGNSGVTSTTGGTTTASGASSGGTNTASSTGTGARDGGADANGNRDAARDGTSGTTTGATIGTTTGGASDAATATSCNGSKTGAYYVDSAAGSDTADGMTPATAWQSLTKVNATSFQPGNAICLKAGGSWTGQLRPKGSGSSTAVIAIDQYGTGAKPKIIAGTADTDAVYLLNQQYWEINNLNVTNKKSALGDNRGISINGQNGGTLNHIYIRGCFVHDVSGEVNWIGGDVADNATGVTFQTGWDESKHTGGIVFDVQAGSGTAVKTKFNDVIVEGNTVQDCSFGGIIFKQLDGSVHWGVRSSKTDSNWTPHTNVVVRNNYLSQLNTNYGCNTVYMTDVQNGLIEGNVTNGAGTSAIELYYTDAVTVQKNETFGTKVKAGGADSNGIDSDKGTTKTIIQYNYIHENGDGILLCQFSFGDSIVRYNVLQNNSRYQIYLHSDKAASSVIYNNTVYNNSKTSGIAYGYGTSLDASYTMTNNLFVSTVSGGVLTTSPTIVHQNNLYFGAGVTPPSGDGKAITSDPRFVSAGMGKSGSASGPAWSSLDGYKLQTGSPALNAGTSISGNGSVDFWGNALYNGNPDLGAYEAP